MQKYQVRAFIQILKDRIECYQYDVQTTDSFYTESCYVAKIDELNYVIEELEGMLLN